MQRFQTGELEQFESYLAKIGYRATEAKIHTKEGKPPLATFILRGKGDPQAVQQVLISSPFLLTELSSRSIEGGMSIRLTLSRREITAGKPVLEPEFGDDETGPFPPVKFDPEMGDDE